MVPLVAAVKPDRLTQQAGADSQPNFFHQPHAPDRDKWEQARNTAIYD
jgi:hypothetical protein